ncbi:hypothetical protein V6N13_004659 [Hibiscus sabdariffa]|uniref:Uncharacterized protein n=1 Tax=Hibiscus sabdariffa TaxID=183260 RepID=A0ABR2RZ66_9ROSI
MEKNQTSCPKVVCEKIFRAITSAPAFTAIRRISNRQQTPSSAAAKHTRNPTSEVPIKFNYATVHLPNPSSTGKTKPEKTKPSTDMVQSWKGKPIVSDNGQQAGSKLKQHQGKKVEGGKKPTQQHYDIKFDAFIHQTREKIMSDDRRDNGGDSRKVVGYGHGHGNESVHKDNHFSDFIKQTRRKIKSTLTIKDRNESFK